MYWQGSYLNYYLEPLDQVPMEDKVSVTNRSHHTKG